MRESVYLKRTGETWKNTSEMRFARRRNDGRAVLAPMRSLSVWIRFH